MNDNSVKFAVKEASTTGIITGVICLVLYLFLEKGGKTAVEIIPDLVSGLLPTSLICVALQFFMKKGAVAKGAVPAMGDIKLQAAYAVMPKNSIVFIVVITVLAVLIFACGVGGALVYFAPEYVFGKVIYTALKSIVSGLAAAYAAFHGIIFFSAKFQAAVPVEK